MLWIGITGPMGSGKSTVGELLREKGYSVLDADAVVGRVLEPGGEAERAIARAFGPGVIDAAGGLDRRALAGVVFADPARLKQLEGILHPRVRAFVQDGRAALARAGAPASFYDVPLLFEKNMESEFDLILVVSAARELRLNRVMARTGLTAPEIEARWARQLPPEYKEARASAVIPNDGDVADLAVALDRALATLKIPPVVI